MTEETTEQVERFIKISFGPSGEITDMEQRNAGPAELFAAAGIARTVAEMQTLALLQNKQGSGIVAARSMPPTSVRKVQ